MDKITMEKAYNHKNTEKEWYKKWMDQELFKADENSDKPPFTLILPPPNVTGSLHMGHALTFTIPDIIVRRKKMQGFNTLWLPGVDHAGIATQMVVEKQLRKDTGKSKEDLGREEFLDKVWSWKEQCQTKIIDQINKLGLSLDWSRMKFTFSKEMQGAVSKVFVKLYNEEKIYQGTYMVNYCPSCKTVLSDLEVDHKEVDGSLTYIKYPVKDMEGEFITVATTRPETMLGDTAIAVHPEDDRYNKFIGKEAHLPLTDRFVKIIGDPAVDREFGTGCVKITPAHDPNDYNMALRHNLESIIVIDKNARITGPVPEKYLDMDRFECRKQIVNDLSEGSYIVKTEPHAHNVGHCQRCSTIVEPLISKQWFLKTDELSRPAIDAVENKEINFIPEKWEKVYFNWMYNIQDWCISRQLWWGHRIPAFYCEECRHMTVSETAPEVCEKCGSEKIVQDEDVLDTWFSSALWPFTTLGWHNNSKDLEVFYPTSLMATGFDIIFFWVARMIMMGIHFTGKIPFRDVLINGLIRDEKGQKMSKTKNNVVDPLDIIAEYGADALRFTMAIQAVPGMDISLSVNRIKGYKAFANKIWNASRFALMNLKGDETEDINYSEISVTDKWILHSMNNTVDKVNLLIDQYKINEAADILYHFFWHEFCDWYLEFSKKDVDSTETRKVLRLCLLTMLQLLHPFMPYITEEIFQMLSEKESNLLLTSYPSFNGSHVFTEEYKSIEVLKKLIMETRKTRTENKIEPNKKIAIFLKSESEQEKDFVNKNIKYFNFLTRSSETTIVDSFDSTGKGFRGVSLSWEILLPFDNDEDRENELVRLQKEFDKDDKQIKVLQDKLSNQNFIDKAPEKVVMNFKNNLIELLDRREKLEKTIKDLS